MDHAFTVCVRDENEKQVALSAFSAHEKSILVELAFKNICYITKQMCRRRPGANMSCNKIGRDGRTQKKVQVLSRSGCSAATAGRKKKVQMPGRGCALALFCFFASRGGSALAPFFGSGPPWLTAPTFLSAASATYFAADGSAQQHFGTDALGTTVDWPDWRRNCNLLR